MNKPTFDVRHLSRGTSGLSQRAFICVLYSASTEASGQEIVDHFAPDTLSALRAKALARRLSDKLGVSAAVFQNGGSDLLAWTSPGKHWSSE